MNKINEIYPTLHGHSSPEPIGLQYIAAILKEAGYTCKFISDIELSVDVQESKNRLILMSGLTYQFPRVMKAAITAKKLGALTLLGGYHACGNNGEVSWENIDHIVHGEGEEITKEIIETLFKNNPIKNGSKKLPFVIKAKQIKNLDTLPYPLRSKKRLSNYYLFDLMWPPKSPQRNVALVLASRGCSNSCDFCASETVWGKGVRLRSPNNVVKELQDLKSRFNTNTIVFIDQSLGQAKQWTLDLCAAIQEANLGLNWYHQSNLTIDHNIVKKMAESGCRKIGFGLEGISPFAINKIKPLNPNNLTTINTLFDYCNALGIFVKVYLMIGFPWETESIIKDYFEWIQQIRANQIKISYMTPFPGTRDWKRYSEQLISRDWADFDTVSIPVVYNPNITVKKYHYIRKTLFKKFYGSKTYRDVTCEMLKRFPHYAKSYLEFAEYLRAFDMINGNEEWFQWVKYPNTRMFC